MKRGGVESRVLTSWDRKALAWAADQAITLWTERRRLAIVNCDRRGIIRAKWHLRRATRLLERLRPSAKPCSRCREWKPIGQFYFHARQDRHDSRCAECRREMANMRYRGGAVWRKKREALCSKY